MGTPRSRLQRSSLLALSGNDVPFDPDAAWTLDPDFGRTLFEDGAREIDSRGGDGEGCGRLKNAAFPAQSPFYDVGHA
jgi:hypothetical protein